MPITIAKMAANTASVTLRYGEDDIHVTYHPGLVTEKMFAQLKAFADMNETSMDAGFESFNDILVHLVASWDVFEDDAQTVMFPLDAARLAELPIPFRTQVLQAILGDIRPNTTAPQTPTSEI